jgi:hypothetical protein
MPNENSQSDEPTVVASETAAPTEPPPGSAARVASQPRWLQAIDNSKALIAFIASLVAAAVPLNVQLGSWRELRLKEKEFEQKRLELRHNQAMQRAQQQQDFRNSFLEKAIVTTRGDLGYQRDVLEFFSSVLEPGGLQGFAVRKLADTKEAIATVKENERLRSTLEQAIAQQRTLATKLETLQRSGATTAEGLAQARMRLKEKTGEVERATQTALQSQAKAEALERSVLTNVEARATCSANQKLITSAGESAAVLARCAQLAPRSTTQVWHVLIDEKDVSCGCVPR